jgi:predicted CXXCH cytochrome family protein
MNFFEQSPHSKGFRKRGFAQCVVCHGNHDVAPASAALVGTTQEATCMKCHSKDDKPRKVAEDIANLLRNARDRAADARAAVDRAHTAGLHVDAAAFALDQVATAELKVRGVVHTLDPNRVGERVSAVERAASDAIAIVDDAERARRTERRGYLVALGLAGLLLVTLALKAAQLERRRRQGAS